MRKADIKVGGSYLVGGHGRGRAVVISEPTPHPYRGRRFQGVVEYPDAPVTLGQTHKENVTTDLEDIVREWLPKDQERFEHMIQRIEDQRGWQEELRNAGFDGTVHITHDDELHLSFSGRAAELAIEKLTGHEFPEEKRGEYIGKRS